ncbi:hypothetical protein FB451DRAFT_690625 [Mycena latifolia]|nr:hypothetical protein FB451DRAFT_690625 [Mycena latifolia]
MDTSRNAHHLPPKIRSAFRRYKEHTAHITKWLIRTARAHNLPIACSADGKYDLALNQYLTLSIELVSKRGVRPPASYKTRFNSLIKLRKKCWEWYSQNTPDQVRSNDGHFAIIGKMREVRKIWFNISLGYDTPDSEQGEPALVLSFSISFAGYLDSSESEYHTAESEVQNGDDESLSEESDVGDADTDDSDDAEEEEDEDDDLSNLPLSAFRLVPDEGDADGEQAELEFGLWNFSQELEEYRNYLRRLWEEHARTGSPSLFSLLILNRCVLLQVIIAQFELEQDYPSVEGAEYPTLLRAVLGLPDNNEQGSFNLVGHLRSFLMVDTWTVLRQSYFQADRQDGLGQEQNQGALNLLMAQLCMKEEGNTTRDGPPEDVPPITVNAVFQLELQKDAIWLDRATQGPLERLRNLTTLVTASIQNWIDTHNPEYYGTQAAELALEARNVIAYAQAILVMRRAAFLPTNPLLRAQEERTLLEKSWDVGKHLITDTSRHRYLATVMSLYLHLRKHNSTPKNDTMDYLQRFLVPLHRGSGVLRFREADDPGAPFPPRGSPLSSLLEWAEEYGSREIAVRSLDAFTIERMAFGILLHRTCQGLLRPYMMQRQPDSVRAPSYVGLVGCFIDAWNAGKPQTVRTLALRGHAALQYGRQSVSNINPSLTFLL